MANGEPESGQPTYAALQNAHGGTAQAWIVSATIRAYLKVTEDKEPSPGNTPRHMQRTLNMAYALSNTNARFNFSATLHRAAEAWKTARAKRAIFDRTFNELNALDDRDLADIGIARSDIRGLAQDFANKAG